jgi:SAM-dependent methyltransferase
LNRRIAQIVDRPTTTKLAVKLYSAVSYGTLKLRNRAAKTAITDGQDGLPRPPDRLIFLVNGTINWDWYLEGGAFTAGEIRESLTRYETRLEDMNRVLDFGCGSGRLIRHFATAADNVDFYGVDYNVKLIRWCASNLSFASFSRNRPEPPLEFRDGYFDLVYAYSVFTHLPHHLQVAWRDELYRLLRPGGFAWITVLNGLCRQKLTREELSRYDAGDLVTRFPRASGANVCTAYPPEQYLQDLFSPATGWQALERRPTGPSWAAPLEQDYILLKKA